MPKKRSISSIDATFPADAARHGIVVAVSGGSDSVALARLAREVLPRESVILAHFNHGVRGAAADADAVFVENLAMSLGMKCVVELFSGDTPRRDDSGSIEATLRAARYNFLRKTAESLGLRYVATGHTRDDQVETVLHRILRGTGLAGLAAIPKCRVLSDAVTLVRPLLHFTRDTLRAYLADIKQSFRDDESNCNEAFTRNRIRHTLLPLLRAEFNPAVDEAIARLASQAAAWCDDLTPLIDATLKAAIIVATATPHSVTLDLAPLRAATPTLLRAVLIALWVRQRWSRRAMGQHHWERLAALVVSGGSEAFPGQVTVTVTDSKIQINTKDRQTGQNGLVDTTTDSA